MYAIVSPCTCRGCCRSYFAYLGPSTVTPSRTPSLFLSGAQGGVGKFAFHAIRIRNARKRSSDRYYIESVSGDGQAKGCRSHDRMKLNEKNVASFATCSSPIDKEGYLGKRGDFSKGYQRRWFVLKGNLLFYFEKKQDKEPLGLIVLEACSVQVSPQAKYALEISFDGQGTRVYVMVADNDEDMESWVKAISHASYEYMRSIVDELQRRVNVLTSSSKADQEAAASEMSLLHVGPAKTRTTQRPAQPLGGRAEKSSSGATRVENGILIDLTEGQPSPPPIPKKMKNHLQVTCISVSTSGEQSHEASPNPQSPQKREAVQMTSGVPHSSPYALPSRLNPVKPLSPPATMDRTAVLQPWHNTPSNADTCTLPPLADIPSQPVKPFEVLGKSSSTVSPSKARPKQVAAAPLDSNKTVFELHEDFTRALSALHQEQNSSGSKHS